MVVPFTATDFSENQRSLIIVKLLNIKAPLHCSVNQQLCLQVKQYVGSNLNPPEFRLYSSFHYFAWEL